jgi:predicted RNA binding protein YcfA (HicA-like mRNA interferase family)
LKTPRDVSAERLIHALRPIGYSVTRQTDSHIRLTTSIDGEHHEVIPNHNPIKIGTLRQILKSIAQHHSITLAQLLEKLNL